MKAAEQAEIQKTIEELRAVVDRRDAEIKHLQKNLKEAETILVKKNDKLKINMNRNINLITVQAAYNTYTVYDINIFKRFSASVTYFNKISVFKDIFCRLIILIYSSFLLNLQSTAIYQAKQKLTAINQANNRKISSEELIKFAHRISASNAVASPPTWAPGNRGSRL